MNWEQRLSEGFTIKGEHYCVQHLKTFTHSYEIKELGKHLNCQIRFSSHCCTEESSTRVEPSHYLNDRGKQRKFCLGRYKASKYLKDLMEGLHEQWLQKDPGGSKNALLVELNYGGTTDVYKIFFNAKKHKEKGLDLNIYVETAHIQYPVGHPEYNEHTAIHSKAELNKLPRIKGAIFLANTYLGRPVKFLKRG